MARLAKKVPDPWFLALKYYVTFWPQIGAPIMLRPEADVPPCSPLVMPLHAPLLIGSTHHNILPAKDFRVFQTQPG